MRAVHRRLLLAGVVAACVGGAAAFPVLADSSSPSLVKVTAAEGTPVPGRYIVTLKKGASAESAVNKVKATGAQRFDGVLNGFAAKLTGAQLDKLRRDSRVAAIEQDQVMKAQGTQGSAPWGLDRIDQRKRPLSKSYHYTSLAKDVTAYVIDSGLDVTHSQFGGRAAIAWVAPTYNGNGADCNGHGTHVAGTVAGRDYGVAPAARMVSVRVLNCTGNGTWAQVLAGMDWVAANAVQPAVLNVSLGGPYSQAVNEATDALARTGVLPVVAAGNATQDACGVSPASADHALTVGATDRDDRQTAFSNYGACVSLFAPGKDIVSALIGGGSVAEDGTSMASPHAAGVALLYKAEHPSASSDQVAAWMLGTSTKDVLSVDHGSPNRLLYTGGL